MRVVILATVAAGPFPFQCWPWVDAQIPLGSIQYLPEANRRWIVEPSQPRRMPNATSPYR
jgi:hypothetical protein